LPVAPVSAIAIDPITPSILYAGMKGGVYKSMDGAASWFALKGGLPETVQTVNAIAIDPKNPETVYTATESALYKTIDGGRTPWVIAGTTYFVVNRLVIDPVNPATMYCRIHRGSV
jgi:hypothetical protein